MPTVLIVDDHPHLVESLQMTIPWEEFGIYELHTAFSGPEAVQILEKSVIDILVTDIRMPGMNGLELIGAAKDLQPHIQCMLLSGYAEFEFAQKAIELQTFRYLLKPVRTDEFISCLRELTGKLQATVNDNTLQSQQPEPRIADKQAVQQRLLETIQNFVHENLDKDVTLTTIAEHVYLHPVYLSKVYKELSGVKLSDFIVATRMEKAKELLKGSHARIYEVCEAVGYRSTQHFITEFKKHTRMTPKQYRESIEG